MKTPGSCLSVALGAGPGLALLGASIVSSPHPRLVWNASASAPLGLYWVSPGAAVGPGDMVVARVPSRYRKLATDRQYLPRRVPLVKQVAAAGGAQVCALGPRLFLDGIWLADRRAHDDRGRAMPWWSGCIRLHRGQFFLLMRGHPLSFDGRYFGVSNGSDVIGKAHLLWAR
jgi:conjugative transfer signal peptidase TraF